MPSLRTILSLIGGAVFIFLGSLLYYSGRSAGINSVQLKWDKAIAASRVQSMQLQEDNLRKEADNRKRLGEIAHELSEVKQSAAVAVVNQRIAYERRLLNSASRANHYYAMSQAGTVEQARLASHAAQLDRVLEEGRYVVADLQSIVKLRDAQLTQLGNQIMSDRALFASGIPNGK